MKLNILPQMHNPSKFHQQTTHVIKYSHSHADRFMYFEIWKFWNIVSSFSHRKVLIKKHF